MEPKPELIAIIAAAVAMAYFFFRRASGPRQKTFRCKRCSAIAQHTPRTMNAWRAGKSSFFCNSCHSEWIRSQPSRRRAVGTVRAGGRSGCLGVLACLLLIPIGIVAIWIYASQ